MVQRVREVMTGRFVTAGPRATLQEVASVMWDEDVGAVLVVEDDRLRGLVTGGDVSNRPVSEACGSELVCVAPDDDVDRAVQLMRAKALSRLAVAEDGRPVGTVAMGDLAVERGPGSVPDDVVGAGPGV
ncbi:CBS domain-containing protein [Streptomyces cinereoruber]|uniref:CBS domain-containing protein n=1 Tax=Streptomyces cinereoruber TaxID=67260 RepID=UPI003631793A